MCQKAIDDSFEKAFMNNAFKDKKSRKASNSKFENTVTASLLSFEAVHKADKKASISRIAGDKYKISFSKIDAYKNILNLLKLSNPNVDLEFTEDYIGFEPDEELVRKSKNPLWVVKILDKGQVLVQKAFA